MGKDAPMTGLTDASDYLRMLLERPGPYRDRWERVATRVSGSRVNLDAVSRVIAAHRAQFDPTGADHRSLNDTVRRALTGRVLTMGTLTEFIDSFGMSGDDASHLRDLLRGTAEGRIITGEAMPPPGLYETIGPRQHQTIAVNELHEVGPDRLPLRHRTIQTIRAVSGEVDHYSYSFDTNASKKHLQDVARRLDIHGRSTMNKGELVDAIKKANRRESASSRSK
jgi:hypothetical protein